MHIEREHQRKTLETNKGAFQRDHSLKRSDSGTLKAKRKRKRNWDWRVKAFSVNSSRKCNSKVWEITWKFFREDIWNLTAALSCHWGANFGEIIQAGVD